MNPIPKILCAALLLGTIHSAWSQRIPEVSGEAKYPPIAKAASVEGDVLVNISVSSDGRVTEAKPESGPAMLQGAAVDYVKGWRYADGAAFTAKVMVRFRLTTPPDGYNDESDTFTTTSRIDDEGNATAIAARWVIANRSMCPHPGDAEPPTASSAADYVELFRGACYGSCPAYTVRVTADGHVIWKSPPFEETAKPILVEIEPAKARALIEEFRVSAFWAACGAYTRSVTDSASYGLEVNIAGRVKHVSEYADSAPEFIHELELRVDEVANTHLWRVGDPKTEIMPDIDSDVFLPKPQRTKLMALVRNGKPEEMAVALAAGDKITDVDSSGWTPLMYAASGYSSDGVKFLLSKGTDPNVRGPKGESALMFSALTGSIDEDLLAAGADVNAATSEGVTALMLLSQRGESDELTALLKAGANAKMKDAKGRTALDYLLAANCGQRIVAERNPWMTIGYSACTAIDEDDFKSARLVLERAGARQTRVWYPEHVDQ